MTWPIRKSPCNQFFIDSKDQPFFYLADTVWMLFCKLKREEIKLLFQDRKQKGFTVIQACVFRDFFTPNTANAYGITPFVNETEMYNVNINPEWLSFVKEIVDLAAEMGLAMALLPTWGDKWNEHSNSAGPVIMDAKKVKDYGCFLSNYFCEQKNIIWVLGGDSPIRNFAHLDILNSMAEGIKQGGSADKLITFHPTGEESSESLHAYKWLDFHGLQSGHRCLNRPDYKQIEDLTHLNPKKPCLNIEPNYELAPMFITGKWGKERPFEPVFSAYDVRKCLYRSVLAGAAGFTYGCDPIRQCYREGDRLHVHDASPMPFWNEALSAPGSNQLNFFAKILLERSYFTRTAKQEYLLDLKGNPIPSDGFGNYDPASHIRIAACSKGSYIMAYIPVRQHLNLNTSKLKGSHFQVSVYHPQKCSLHIQYQWENTGNYLFTPEWDLDTFVVFDAMENG